MEALGRMGLLRITLYIVSPFYPLGYIQEVLARMQHGRMELTIWMPLSYGF